MKAKRINPKGHELDTRRLGQENFVVLKARADKKLAELAGVETGARSELTADQIVVMRDGLAATIENISAEL